MLHVAPEQGMVKILEKRIGSGYVTADLNSPEVMVKLDITQIPCGDKSFDVIYCSNVLEHIPDDKRAIRELYRVLKADGWAVILVPVTADVTFEDASITEPEERLKYFGQEDHVRRYGPDFITRLEEPGFIVRVISPHDILSREEITLMGITASAGDIYFCTKQ
ncbi:methyltransferase domain-containing protein [bacterium]|nr:methyltransferase domain-containing protein [bacterium]